MRLMHICYNTCLSFLGNTALGGGDGPSSGKVLFQAGDMKARCCRNQWSPAAAAAARAVVTRLLSTQAAALRAEHCRAAAAATRGLVTVFGQCLKTEADPGGQRNHPEQGRRAQAHGECI